MYAVERREKLIRTLVLRGHTTVSELAMELEVSERTILRDIEKLSTSTLSNFLYVFFLLAVLNYK